VIERAPESNESKLQEEIAAMRAENERLAGQLKEAQWALAEARTRVDELESVKSATTNSSNAASEKARADEANARLATLVAGVDQLTQEKATLESKLAAATKAESELKQQLADARRAAAPPDAAAKQADTERKLAEATERNSLLRAENELLRTSSADHARVVAELQTLKQERADLDARLARAESSSVGAVPQKELDDVTTRLANTESRLATVLRSYSQLQAELAQAKSGAQTNADTSAELTTLRQENAALKETVASQRPEETKEIAAKLAEVENRLATTLRSYSQLQAENDRLKAAAASQSDLSTELAALREENATLKNRVEANPPEMSQELTAKLAETEDKLATTLRSYSQLQTQNDQLRASASNQGGQSAELEKLRRENAELAEQIAANPTNQSHQLASRLAEVEDRLSTVLRSYTLLQRENDQLRADANQAIDSAHSSAAKAANDAANQTSALFDELRQTQAGANALAAENAQLKTRLALVGSPPGSTLSSPSRPGSSAPIASVEPTEPPAAPVTPPPAAPRQRTHVVALGDTLGKISRLYYGTPGRWDEILEANRDVVKNENVLTVGTTLRIP
jgi:chromosome segregation ATPase